MRQQDLRPIESIDLPILQQLKKDGVQFSEMGNAIIAKKVHNSIGFFVSILINLGKFTEFVKSKLPKIFKPDERNDAINKCNEFRKQFKDGIQSPSQQEEKSNPKVMPQDPPQI